MLSKYLLATILIISVFTCKALAQDIQTSAYANALCGAISSSDGFHAVGYNPAGSALSDLCAEISYSNKFGLKELSYKSARVAVPVGNGAVSSGVNYYGFQLFNRTSTSLSYATRLGKIFYGGISLRYHTLHIDYDVEKGNTLGGDIGFLVKADKNWWFSSWISNITNSQFNGNDTLIPIRIVTGVHYAIHGGHSISVDLEKSSLYNNILVHVGASAKIYDWVDFQVGLSTNPLTIGAGLECEIKGMDIQFAAQRTEPLGWSPSVSISYTFRKAGEKKLEQ